jgi:WD40 repeat protein
MRFKLLSLMSALALGSCSQEQPISRTGPSVSGSLEGASRLGHSPGRQTLFSPDGKLLAASNAAGEITVRRKSDWRVVRRLSHEGGSTSLAFSPNGRLLFTAGYDGRVRVWDLQTGRQRLESQVATGTIWSLDVSPDGRWLAASGEDKVVRLVPLRQSGRRSQPLQGHELNVWEVRFSPRGDELASGSFDHTARLWSLTSPGRKVLRGHTQAVVSVDYSPDGQWLATSGDDSTIRFWRKSDAANVRTIHAGNHVYKLEFSPDGRWLASSVRARGAIGTFWYQLTGSGGAATPLQIWRVSDGALVAALPHPTDVFSVSYSPDGHHIATTDEDGNLRVWKIS